MTLKQPKTRRCERCKTKFKVQFRGRVPKFCSRTCRQHSYEQHKWARPTLIELLAQDIASVRVRDVIRAEILSILNQAGLVPEPTPPSAHNKTSPGHHLKLVK